ncbi:hypothetical protein [Clostridium sp. BJN0001]|uniref:hypothetical protein n=1 Tax=Clostridium sp. BJN0001 TaxID=2930219 RepID=UPI001FD2BD41|nr:hypothetical protein [Clostridium sp. BJN0001]
MPFLNKFNIEISISKKILIKIRLDQNIYLDKYDKNNVLLSTYKIENGSYLYDKVWFSKMSDFSICGLLLKNSNKLIYIYINLKKNFIIKECISNKISGYQTIEFPYIYKNKDSTHIFFYINYNKNPRRYYLVHYYYNKHKWNKNIICNSLCAILTNYVSFVKENECSVFYLKGEQYFEEIYYRYFDFNTLKWSDEEKITDNKKRKVYLAVVKDKKKNYHIAYSESNGRVYNISYIHLSYINENKYVEKYNNTVSKTIAPMYPNIILTNSVIYVQWIEYSSLYYLKINSENFHTESPMVIGESMGSIFLGCINNDEQNFVSFINKNGKRI